MIEEFNIRLLEIPEGNSIFELKGAKKCWESKIKGIFQTNPIVMEADPFLFSWHGRLFLFYESKRLFSPGVIMMRYTDDLLHWSDETLVLQESFHLSFPNVFEHQGQIYMLPETNEADSIRLYRADNDGLTSFSLCKVLVEKPPFFVRGVSFVDSIIVPIEGVYYLFTTVMHNGKNTLLLYYADNLIGEYVYSSISPLLSDNHYGRNAGSVVVYDDCLFRISQDCSKTYGENVSVHKIKSLAKDLYVEEIFIDNLFDRKDKFFFYGGHQFNVAFYKGKYIVATDAKNYNYYFWSRLLRKIKRLFE